MEPVTSSSPQKWPENEAKFRELILYICMKCANDPRFGATKLNKLLYFSDFLAYAELEKPITGFEYQRLQNGPAPRRLTEIRQDMIGKADLGFQIIPLRGGRRQHRVVNLRSADLADFTAAEISVVDRVIDDLWDLDAEAVSDLSHRIMGWKFADINETIPYETVFISADPLTEVDVQRARELGRLVNKPHSDDH